MAPDFAERYPDLMAMETGSAPQPPAPAPAPGEEAVPYPEREARETFDVGLGVLLDGIEAAIGRTATP